MNKIGVRHEPILTLVVENGQAECRPQNFEMATKEHNRLRLCACTARERKEKPTKDRMTGFTGLNRHQRVASHAQEILFILFILSKLRF
jgi:hypothetical protein